jgi:cell division protein FtsN
MIKWLFSTLLIANLGMFIWLIPQYKGETADGGWPEDVGHLLLARESSEELPKVGEAAEQAPEIPSVLEEMLQVDAVTREFAQSPQPSPLVVASERIEVDTRPAPEPKSEETQPSQLPPMLVASERTEEDTRFASEPKPEEVQSPSPTLPQPSPQPSSVSCGTVGVFNKRAQAELLSVRMLREGVTTEITSESINQQAGFWVLIPPQKDRNAAIREVKKLEAAGVTDLWRFTSGDLAHAISLGLFRDEGRANARRDKIANLGFDAEVRPRYRQQTNYSLKYRYSGVSPLSEARWKELSEQNPELEREEAPCPD